MNAIKKVARPKDADYSAPTDADKVRALLTQAGLSQRGAAAELEISERAMRYYCGGDKVPRVVMLALERLVDLQRRVGDSAPDLRSLEDCPPLVSPGRTRKA